MSGEHHASQAKNSPATIQGAIASNQSVFSLSCMAFLQMKAVRGLTPLAYHHHRVGLN